MDKKPQSLSFVPIYVIFLIYVSYRPSKCAIHSRHHKQPLLLSNKNIDLISPVLDSSKGRYDEIDYNDDRNRAKTKSNYVDSQYDGIFS